MSDLKEHLKAQDSLLDLEKQIDKAMKECIDVKHFETAKTLLRWREKVWCFLEETAEESGSGRNDGASLSGTPTTNNLPVSTKLVDTKHEKGGEEEGRC